MSRSKRGKRERVKGGGQGLGRNRSPSQKRGGGNAPLLKGKSTRPSQGCTRCVPEQKFSGVPSLGLGAPEKSIPYGRRVGGSDVKIAPERLG